MGQASDLSEMLRAVARSDRDAFRKVYDAASSKLYGIALRICHESAIAEDAVQEAFAEIWRKAGDFDPQRGNAMAWMTVIARNRAIDAVRRRTRGGHEQTGMPDEMLSAVIDPRQRADGGVAYMALAACLAELEPRDREAVLRAYYRGESREELAERFDAPVNTVKTWLRRALAALKGCLER